MKNVLMAVFVGLFCSRTLAQTLPVGMPVLEERASREQLQGKLNPAISFTIRPLHSAAIPSSDSLMTIRNNPFGQDSIETFGFAKGKGILRLLPIHIRQQYNSRYPYFGNDGAMIPAKGYQTLFSAGIYTSIGPLSFQFQPEFVFAQNADLSTFPARYNDTLWRTYYDVVANRIDAPEQFGRGTYSKLTSGQSSIRLNLKKISLGFSTENLWWGPGRRNALVMSNHAPGFPHITFNTTEPIRSSIGSFEGQLISGWLHPSGFLPTDTARTFNSQRLYAPKPSGNRYLNGLVFTWQPKWTKGLFLGFTRMFYLYQKDVESSINGYLPVIGRFFKGESSTADSEDARKRDQMFSLFFRLLLPKENAEVYGEFGRNDHSGNMRDLLMEPEHSRAYIIGLRKIFAGFGKGYIELFAEFCTLQRASTNSLRAQESWYSHYQVRDGYTHLGQVMGASVGPGGSSQTVSISHIKDNKKTGLLLERIVHDNDFYYAAFTPTREFWRHWVDYSVQLSRSWQQKRFLYEARLGWMKSLSYQWQPYTDLQNYHLTLSVSYLL